MIVDEDGWRAADYAEHMRPVSPDDKRDAVEQPAIPVLGDILKRARTHRRLSLREVERRTNIPNAHLSQIERGIIKRPDPSLIFELATVYRLNFPLLIEWAGYSGERHDGASASLLEPLLAAFADLDPKAQAEAVEFLNQLRHARMT